MQCVGSVMTFFMNQILMAFSATAVAVFGVYFKLQSFVFMPIFGMNNGMVPIISYNYGARRPDARQKDHQAGHLLRRVHHAHRLLRVPVRSRTKLLSLFAASDAMLAIGIPALRIICPHFLLAGIEHRAELGVPGAGQRRVQPHRLRLPPAGGADPCRMAAEPDRQREYGLVVVPHRGSGQR